MSQQSRDRSTYYGLQRKSNIGPVQRRLLAPLAPWVLETFLPQLPENVLTVVAGREPPPAAWRYDPGWQTLVQVVPLRNLAPFGTRELLTRRRVPPEQYQPVLEFTHGHPLAVSLVAELLAHRPGLQFQPETQPDVDAGGGGISR